MYLLNNLEADFSRLDKRLTELSSDELPDQHELAAIVGEISNSCVLILDKTMNRIWKEYGVVKSGKNKANVYFPLNQKERKALIQRLSSLQLNSIIEDHHQLFEIIDDVQPYNGKNVLNFAHQLAGMRHEKNPEIKEGFTESIKVGRDKIAYLRSASNITGELIVDGYKIDKQGNKEALEVTLEKRIGLILDDQNLDAMNICKQSIHETKKVSRPIFKYISRSK